MILNRADERSSSVKRLFDDQASIWPSKYARIGRYSERKDRLTTHVAKACQPPAAVLDFGCGTGELSVHLEGMGYLVTACDISDHMLATALQLHAQGYVKWVRLDTAWERLPFESATFDLVLASSVLEYVRQPGYVLGELARVLRKDGRLIATLPNPAWKYRRAEAAARLLLRLPGVYPVCEAWPRLSHYCRYLLLSDTQRTGDEWLAMANAAGLVVAEQVNERTGPDRLDTLITLVFRKE